MRKEASVAVPKTRRRTIGVLAREAGVNVETVRYYERRGLLRKPQAKGQGWREYEESALWMIHYVKLAQKLGFGLAEIKDLSANLGQGRRFCASFQKALENKIALVSQKIAELHGVRRELKKSLSECLRKSATGDCPIARRCKSEVVMPGPQLTRSREP